jgi:glutaredoxin 3
MKIQAYTLPTCNYCVTLKELFRRASVEYTEIMVKKDITTEEFSKLYPNVGVFPFIVVDNEPIGGLVETIKLFLEKGLVSSSKK